MKSVTSGYKQSIAELGRELAVRIGTKTYNQFVYSDYTSKINNLSINYDGGLLKSVMKQFEFDCDDSFNKDELISVQLGVKVGDSYEYNTLGSFIINSVEKQEDTNSYRIVGYDLMIKTMVDYDNHKATADTTFQNEKNYYTKTNEGYTLYEGDRTGNPKTLNLYEIYLTYPISLKTYLSKICNRVGLSIASKFSLSNFPNSSKEIQSELYLDSNGNSLGYTFRDVLGEIAQATGTIAMINNEDQVDLITPYEITNYFSDAGLYNNRQEIIDTYSSANITITEAGTMRINNSNSVYPIRVGITNGDIIKHKKLNKYSFYVFQAKTNASSSSHCSLKVYYTNEQGTSSKASSNYLYNNFYKIITLSNIEGEISSIEFEVSANKDVKFSEILFREVTYEEFRQIILDNNHRKIASYIPYNNNVIDEKYFNDINVKVGEKYGPINSIVLSRSADSDNVYLQDEDSVEENGLCELKIRDNQIMNGNDRSDYLPEILKQLDGLTYHENDFSTQGITFLELGDLYNVKIGENTYPCLMLNDEINIRKGLEENIYTEKPEESVTDYKKADKTDMKITQTYIIANKAEGKVEAVVNAIGSNGEVTGASLILAINNDTSIAEISADKINLVANDILNILASNSINLTSKNISINSTNFNVSSSGAVTCSDITINGGDIHLYDDNLSPSIGNSSFWIRKTNDNNKYMYITPEQILLTDNDKTIDLSIDSTGGRLLFTTPNQRYITDIGYDGISYAISNETEFSVDTTGTTFVRNLTQGSLESTKKNFKKFENAIEIIKKGDIYSYNLKKENDDEKKHIGMVIPETKEFNVPEEIISKDKKGIDLYSMCSVLWQAVKEQQQQIDKLKKEIENLKK